MWIFAINDFPDGCGYVVTINSKEYWKKSHSLDDSTPDEIYEQMDLIGLGELVENTWEPMQPMSREEAAELMEANGFERSTDMEEWLDGLSEGL